MNTNETYCQSCGMPMGETDELYGTNADGSKSAEYCHYCYKDGAFTFDCTMDEMVEQCVQPMVDGNPGMTADDARKMMQEFFPQLKRWQQA